MFLWVVTLLMSLVGGFIIFATMTVSKGAPQEAAGYAMACAFAVVPYVFARSAQLMRGIKHADRNIDRIIAAIEGHTKTTDKSTDQSQ